MGGRGEKAVKKMAADYYLQLVAYNFSTRYPHGNQTLRKAHSGSQLRKFFA